MAIPERVRQLMAEFGVGDDPRFADALERHFREVERETREDCRRAARVRAETASAVGDAAGARAAADVAAFIASGRVERG